MTPRTHVLLVLVLGQAQISIMRSHGASPLRPGWGRVTSVPQAAPCLPACLPTPLDSPSTSAPASQNTLLRPFCWAAGCTPIDGYSVEANLNGGAGGLRLASSFAAAAAECNADASCAGFNNYGWLLPALAPKQAAQGICLYTRLPTRKCRG